MQYKLFKKSTLYLGFLVLFMIGSIVALVLTRQYWNNYAIIVIIGYLVITYLLTVLYNNYDLNTAKKMTQKMVSEHKVALAKVKGGCVVRVIRDAKLKKFCLWNMEIDIYDQDMNIISTNCIEKFELTQTRIPQGYIWVTYDPKDPEKIFAIPMVAISSDPTFAPLAEMYESKIRPTYLNCYYRNGLVIQSYRDSLKEKKEYEELINGTTKVEPINKKEVIENKPITLKKRK